MKGKLMPSRPRIALGIACSLAAIIASTAPATGQVSARQGTPEDAAGQSNFTFVSPMVLEAPLPVVPGNDTIFSDFSRYTCDGVAVRMIRIFPAKPKGGRIPVVMKLMLNNTTEVDKYTDVHIEVLVNDIVVAKAARGGMDTESGKMILRRMQFSIPESAFEPDAEAVFRVTVSSRVA
jgi:hypothetical protein